MINSQDRRSPQPRNNLTVSRVDTVIDRWQAELLDLSKGNRLLHSKPGRGSLSLIYPRTDLLFHGLVNQGQSFTFYQGNEVDGSSTRNVDEQLALVLETGEASSDSRKETSLAISSTSQLGRPPYPNEIIAAGDPKKIQATLYRLRLKARSALQEQGTNVLFVACGMLDWVESSTSTVRIQTPLLLIPVYLDRDTSLAPYKLSPLDEGIVFNPVLTRKLEVDFNLNIGLPDESNGDLTLEMALDHVRRAVAGQRDWVVRTDAHLGLFSFAKYAMYADLAAHREQVRTHPVVRLISGEEDGLPEPVGNILLAEHLDDHTKPSNVFQVLDADASQQEAIAVVKAGANLVIQGPPGTGKSQTITNIIGECLAQGKTVLFVSEKMAALQVVAKRLTEAGLQEFCLEAHSQGVNKAKVVQDLAATLNADRQRRKYTSNSQLERILLLRRELNGYVRALHARNNSLGNSVFQVHGEIARRAHFPAVPFDIPQINLLTPQRLAELIGVVQRLAQLGDAFLTADNHPWHGCILKEFNPVIQANFDNYLRRLEASAANLAQAQTTLRESLGLPDEKSLEAAEWLRDLLVILDNRTTIPVHWLRVRSLSPLIIIAERFQRSMDDYRERRAKLLERYTEGIFDLDLPSIEPTLKSGGEPYAGYIRDHGVGQERAVTYRIDLKAAVQRVQTVLDTLRDVGLELSSKLGLPSPTTLVQARTLKSIAELILTNPRPYHDWFESNRRVVAEELVSEAGKHQETLTANRAALQSMFQDEIFEVATAEMAARFEESYASWLRVLKPSYYRDLGRLRSLLTNEETIDYISARDVLRQARRVAASQGWLDEHRQELSAALGHHYAGSRTDWAAVEQALSTVRTISELHNNRELPPQLINLLLGNTDVDRLYADISMYRDAVTEADEALMALNQMMWWPSLSRLQSPKFALIQGLDRQYEQISSASIVELLNWLQEWLNGITPLWHAVEQVSAYQRDGTRTLSIAEMSADVQQGLSINEIEAEITTAASELQAKFGHLFNGISTRWENVLEALAWAGRVQGHFRGVLPDAFIDALTQNAVTASDERSHLIFNINEVTACHQFLRRHFVDKYYRIGAELPERASLIDVAAWAREKRASLRQLEEWVDLNQARIEAEAMGLTPFLDQVLHERLTPTSWNDIFLRQLYTLWLTWRYSNTPELARFRAQHHAEVINEFRKLDRWQWEHTAIRIAERLVEKRPLITDNIHPKSEPAILLKEASKRRRFRPLRKLFADLPNLLPVLKPCMLLSPLAVAQFLGESALTFDVVIFDEASQILPADAIGTICRGRQLVVVGDQQQLPPTRFFTAEPRIVEEDDDEEIPESILDTCMAAGMQPKPLLWHYRSRHEDLIAFSNRHFYNRRLITFPSPQANKRAVEFMYVEHGVYDRASSRVNRIEAKWIAHLVIEHVEQHPEQSLGVITFSEAQMIAIQTELDARKRVRPGLEDLLREDRAEGFFVKNLENVQGDERDVILFSVGYGPDQAGNMTMNFGPLNRQGGERRLNVAITRARDRIKILASFRPYEIDRSRTQSKGVHLLRSYLEFAEQGPKALLADLSSEGGEPESPFEEAVVDALQSHGLRIVSQVGVGAFRIDMAVKDEVSDHYILGIECDGATYHSSKTARDRDRLRQEVLERLGWTIHRIWSTDWIKDPVTETKRVLAAVEQHAPAWCTKLRYQ
jgi:very-short-patch-repair endonuclease/ribosomal protein L17